MAKLKNKVEIARAKNAIASEFMILGAVLLLSFSGFLWPLGIVSSQEQEQETDRLTFVIENQGGSLEGHTPRGFQGQGTGLFAGDNLNPNFPDGDGVQMFLSFDLSEIPTGEVFSAILKSEEENVKISGNPFESLGDLKVEKIKYDEFSSSLWNLESFGFACIFSETADGPFECDVSDAIEESLRNSDKYAQFRILFDRAGDFDGSQDLVMFFKTDSNTNEEGIFSINVEIVPYTDGLNKSPENSDFGSENNKDINPVYTILLLFLAGILITIVSVYLKFGKSKD